MEEKEPLKGNTSEMKYEEGDDLENKQSLIKDHEEEEVSSKINDENVRKLIDEETTEPQLMYLCQKDPQACILLKKCSKLASEKKWLSLKDYLETIEDIKSVKNTEPSINYQNFIKNFYLGIAHFRLKNYLKALNNFIEAHKIYQFHQLNYNISLCYIKLGNLENAVFYLEAITKDNKEFFFAYYNLIKIYLKKNNINDAFLIYRDFSDVIKKQKEREKNISGLNVGRNSILNFNTLKLFHKVGAECLFAKQLYQECVYTILEALRFNPDDIELWLLYAKVFVMKKNFKMSIALLNKALEIDPNYIEAKRLLIFLENNS